MICLNIIHWLARLQAPRSYKPFLILASAIINIDMIIRWQGANRTQYVHL